MAIGQDCAARLKEPFRSVGHGELLYDDGGLPRSTRRRSSQFFPTSWRLCPVKAIESAAKRRVSAANFFEAAVIIDASRDPIAS
jgi:hypothetical protein